MDTLSPPRERHEGNWGDHSHVTEVAGHPPLPPFVIFRITRRDSPRLTFSIARVRHPNTCRPQQSVVQEVRPFSSTRPVDGNGHSRGDVSRRKKGRNSSRYCHEGGIRSKTFNR